MPMKTDQDNSDGAEPDEPLSEKEDYAEKREAFMRRHLRNHWPKRIVLLIGIAQFLFSIGILGIDFPIIFMYAPRWETFAGCWTFVLGFAASVSTMHSFRKTTWMKVKVAVGLNVLAAVATLVMIILDLMFAINPHLCLSSSGCHYLRYIYAKAPPFFGGQIVLGVALIVALIAFIVVFVSYAIPGTSLFDKAQPGSAPVPFNSFSPRQGMASAPRSPTNAPGMRMGGPMTGPTGGSYFPPAAPGMMMYRSRAQMATPRSQIPMMTLGPRGHVQGYEGQVTASSARPQPS